MFWALHAIQSGRAAKAKRFLAYPPEAATTAYDSKFAVYKWDLETLICLTLNTPKANLPTWLVKPVNTRQFNTVAELVNSLRAVEDDESEIRINNSNILLEMHRVAHRQFAWQRGWARTVDIYRYLYIYGQGQCAEYFEKTFGLTISDFFGVSFGLFAILQEGPWSKRITGMELLGIGEDAVDKTYNILSDEIWAVRRESMKLLKKFEDRLGTKLHLIYQPSYLRVKPILRSASLHNQYIAPLPELIMLRSTLGLYYDLAPGGTTVMNDANARFEEYARRSIKAYCPDFDPAPAVPYLYKKNNLDTPDILMKRNGAIVTVFECKATKLTFEAQYGDDPIENAKAGYTQIAKAIFQLWKFFSHVRRGILPMEVAPDATAVVLTMEPWTQMSGELRELVIAEANEMAADKEPDMTEEDKRRPVFCPIQDLDELLAISTEDQLLQTLQMASEEKYLSWGARQLRKKIAPEDTRKPVPFDLGELLPWWKCIEERKEARKAPKTS
jgi:hypothetical protein